MRPALPARLALLAALATALVACTPEAPLRPRPPFESADRILIEKAARRLTLYSGERTLRSYRVSLGFAPVGPKRQEGDGKTPEGHYRIDWRNPDSRFHRSLHVSYPDAGDVARAAARGVSPGGLIMIHGLPNGFGALGDWHRTRDWTDGCIAVTNDEMDEIWALVADGTPIEIRP
ncbi:MAG TPA: L,D-transpeptidase family protein [Plasticicumulans sp.]|nr:L,D-transpeptidase family protein [Plasticicumulans sp.]